MRKMFRCLAGIIAIFCMMIMGAVIYFQYHLPNRYYVNRGETLTFSQDFLDSNTIFQPNVSVSSSLNPQNQQINLMGLFPIKNVSVEAVEPVSLIPSGDTFGVKMFTKGAMVVGMMQIPTASGACCPGKDAGIKEGDMILSVNEQPISRNEEVAQLIENSKGNSLHIEIQRGEQVENVVLTPVLSSIDHKYKSGIWIRDSAAGIGTITYIDPVSNVFAGLGHAICDIDTGEILPVGKGEVCDVTIHDITKGKSGTPGELLGVFTSNESIGNIVYNNDTGIYGQLFESTQPQTSYLLAYKQEIQPGDATILCSLENGEKKEYQIQILSVDYTDKTQTKNMTIQVVDPTLLELTGGIVQGMSGTPILQNGKLVGAVTHVFVNNPEKGYAIFAENMYQNSKTIHKFENAA